MRPVVALCSAALALTLAGCGGGAASEVPGAATEVPSAAASDPDATTGPLVTAVDVAPCDLLTADDVAAATGLTVAEVVDQPPVSCVFDLGADAGVDVFISVEDGEGRMIAPAAVFEAYEALVGTGEAEPVAGLGVAAVYAPGFRGLAVDAGDGRYIALGVNGGYGQLAEPRDVLAALARAAIDRL